MSFVESQRSHNVSDDVTLTNSTTAGVTTSGHPALGRRQVGPYVLEREIGRGGMGVVYKAHDPRLERDLALKFLPWERDDGAGATERFLAEARAASVLDHPNICTIFDVGETEDGGHYIAMAYYDGETVEDKIRRGALPVHEAVEIATGIAQGLERAHEAGIVHRDIKPSNVFVTTRGEVKILDFGIAKLATGVSRTGTGTVIGSAAYMAPEQARGESVDARADLWSLGVVLYEMLTGDRPFVAVNPVAALYRLLEHEPPPVRQKRDEVSTALSEVVRRAMAKVRSRRFGDASEFLAALRSSAAPPKETASPRTDTGELTSSPGQLPAALSSFVGREEELDEITALLDSARLVTLTGPGGTGKTRLALEAAKRAAANFADGDGVCFVALASVRDPELVPTAIAKALNVTEKPQESTLHSLLQSFCDQRRLLVLDNFEQVVAAAPVVAELLTACPELVVLVTSRVVLRLEGEHVYPVPPLTVPENRPVLINEEPNETQTVCRQFKEVPAVALFVQRARAVRPGFKLTGENADAVAEICRRLDGLPLAIELAASRVRLFSPEALLPRLEQRLDVLRSAGRDRPERHQTLRQAVAWSYELLNDEERSLFHRLAVFVGGFCLEGAQSVAPTESTLDILDGVASLVDHSLLRQRDDLNGEPRFQMLETIREFALESLGTDETRELRRIHAEYLLQVAEEAEPELTGPRPDQPMDLLEREHDNLRAALAFFEEEGEAVRGLRLGAALWRFWFQRGHLREGFGYLQRLLALPESATRDRVRAKALFGAGTMANTYGLGPQAREIQEESLSIWREIGDDHGTALALNHLGWIASQARDRERVSALSMEALKLHEAAGDKRGMAVAWNNMGWAAANEGDFEAGQKGLLRALELRREARDLRGIGYGLVNLAWVEQQQGETATARKHLEEAQGILKDVNDQMLNAWVYLLAGRLAVDRGELEEAVRTLELSLPLWRQSGSRSGHASMLEFFGETLIDLGQVERARSLLEEALEIRIELNAENSVAKIRATLDKIA